MMGSDLRLDPGSTPSVGKIPCGNPRCVDGKLTTEEVYIPEPDEDESMFEVWTHGPCPSCPDCKDCKRLNDSLIPSENIFEEL